MNLATLECLAGKEVHDDVKRYLESRCGCARLWLRGVQRIRGRREGMSRERDGRCGVGPMFGCCCHSVLAFGSRRGPMLGCALLALCLPPARLARLRLTARGLRVRSLLSHQGSSFSRRMSRPGFSRLAQHTPLLLMAVQEFSCVWCCTQ